MELEYAKNQKYKCAFLFNQWERDSIAECLILKNKKLLKKIESIENSPKNEGQVTFSEQIRDLRNEINNNIEIAKTMSDKYIITF
jgi:hypothetical protein